MTQDETDDYIIANKDCNMLCTRFGYRNQPVINAINCECYYYKPTDIDLNFNDYIQECCKLYDIKYLKELYGRAIYKQVLGKLKLKRLKEILQ